jgi:hypothetical protein
MNARWVVSSASVFGALVACGSAAPVAPNAGTRASGQSALMDQTFAGRDRCNPSQQDRPFVIEWDATDISSFLARASNDVVFVKYEGCNLTVIDSCNEDSVRGTYGSYKPIEWTSGAVEKVDIENSADLYAKLPLGASLLGGRVESGEKFHMEYFVTGTRSATRPAIYSADLAKNPGCNGVTHFVYGYNLGAFALGSRANIKGSVNATIWGAGAGADTRSQSAIDKKGGEISACTAESAKELDGCKVPIRLTLRTIADGASPNATAAQAPETPSAMNLAGQLQARTDAERQAQEHMSAAFTKMMAGDGRGCLTELDGHDALDPRPEGLSTNPKNARTRAMCVMLSGQCDAGKALDRKSLDGLSIRAEDIDDRIDSDVGSYCRDGGTTDRDRLARALHVLGSTNESHTADECRRALETADRVVDHVQARDTRDMAYDAHHAMMMYAPACFARAGDCVSAWHAAQTEQASNDRAHGRTTTETGARSLMWSSTRTLCVDKDQGPMSDRQALYRSIDELKNTSTTTRPTSAFCSARVDAGKAALTHALAAPHAEDLKFTWERLADGTAECFANASDCDHAWHRYAEIRHAFASDDMPDFRTREKFRDAARSCQLSPQGAMSPRETVFFAESQLEAATRAAADAKICNAAYAMAKNAAPKDVGDHSINSEWHYGTRDIPRYLGRCLQRATDCSTAYAQYKDAYARFHDHPSTDEQKIRDYFGSDVAECKSH